MPAPFLVAAAIVAAVGTVRAGVNEVMGNYDESDGNRTRASDVAGTGEQEWSGDRAHINNELARVSEGFDGEYAPATATREAFKTWTHQQIWEALNGNPTNPGVESADINAGADGWRRLTGDLSVALDTFGKNVDTVINEKWGGRSANAAVEGTRTFTTEAQKLVKSFEMVANGIDLMQGYLAQAKMSIVPPVEVSGFDEFVGHIPGNGVVKAAKHRANEAQTQAQDLMIEFYQPGITAIDTKTPVLPVTKSPVGEGPGTPQPVGPAGTQNPVGTNPSGSNPTGTNPSGTNPQDTAAPGQETPQDSATNPAGTETPAPTTPSTTTTPANTVPLEEPVGRPNTTTPGLPSGAPMVAAPGGQQPAGTPGRTVSGAPGSPNQTAGPATRSGSPAATRGMSGAPGAMGAGGQRGRGEDEDEHKTPDYLVQDRATELLGEQPRVLPPGGVIGA
ncbi:hypothetical protein [Nocardia jinanensis]|uniref:PPE domain-containing protein n=1 Tax=Nocardia jinanensis TaxID=382504 RepID=A0A917VYC0_9NOCA|nr:hypothetical protein [Nocardia jinanensis]GGL45103.1 hypothetical protein GCM10011588_69720 [Nocardia jinanensis]